MKSIIKHELMNSYKKLLSKLDINSVKNFVDSAYDAIFDSDGRMNLLLDRIEVLERRVARLEKDVKKK